jgi:hypothetical protein
MSDYNEQHEMIQNFLNIEGPVVKYGDWYYSDDRRGIVIDMQKSENVLYDTLFKRLCNNHLVTLDDNRGKWKEMQASVKFVDGIYIEWEWREYRKRMVGRLENIDIDLHECMPYLETNVPSCGYVEIPHQTMALYKMPTLDEFDDSELFPKILLTL